MRIPSNFSAKVLTIKSTEYNGNTYYKLGLITDNDDVGEVSCSQEVANYVKKDKLYYFGFSINTDKPNVFINSVSDYS